jgi:hypothetical protein
MLKRTSIALLFAILALGATASAQTQPAADELMFHRTAAGGTEITQRAVILPLPPPPRDAALRPQFANVPPPALPLAVAVERYLLDLGHLQDGPYGMSVTRTDNGWTVTVTSFDGVTDFTIHSPGPTFPKPTDNIARALVSILAVRYGINNGY